MGSAPQSAADHFDPLADVSGSPGDDLYQASSLGRGTMQYDVPLETEQSHRNSPRALPNNGWAERRHPHSAGRGHHQSGEGMGIPEPGRVNRGELEQLVVEGGAHPDPRTPQAWTGEAATASR